MKNALVKAFSIITTVSALALCSQTVQAGLVYDNTTTRLPQRFGSISGFEFGDEIILAGGGTTITNFSIEYFGTNFSGTEQLTVRIYALTGPTNATSRNAFTPGATPLYDSGPFNIAQTPGATLTFDSVNIAVPERLAWTIEFSGVVGSELAGLNIYNPPTLGNNFNDFWRRGKGGAWQLENDAGGTPMNFGARFEAVPEPSPAQLAALAGLALLGFGIYRRKTAKA